MGNVPSFHPIMLFCKFYKSLTTAKSFKRVILNTHQCHAVYQIIKAYKKHLFLYLKVSPTVKPWSTKIQVNRNSPKKNLVNNGAKY